VPIKEFLKPTGFWSRGGEVPGKNLGDKSDPRARYIAESHERLQKMMPADAARVGFVRVPQRGGELFVSSDPASPLAPGAQADLNAAANIGLKALLDPDWPGAWWYVPCDSQTLKPLDKSTKGCAAFPPGCALAVEPGGLDPARGDRPINLWEDVSSTKLTERIWMTVGCYWKEVNRRVIALLRDQFAARCARIESSADEPF